jgi:hypothetical protein
MKKIATFALVASAILLTTGAASAFGHKGPAPSDLGLLAFLQWEIEHFVEHLGMTYQAIQLAVASPALGWALLADQTLCANASYVAHLFATAWGSLATFAFTIAAGAAAVVWLARKMSRAVLGVAARPLAA